MTQGTCTQNQLFFYRDRLSFSAQIKSPLKQEDKQEIILFNDKEILIDESLFFV